MDNLIIRPAWPQAVPSPQFPFINLDDIPEATIVEYAPVETPSNIHFLEANTDSITIDELANDCIVDLEAELKAKKSHITKQKEAVMTRFGHNEIPSDVYTVTVAGLNDQLETIESKLIEAAKFTSNHTMDVDAIVATCCKLADLWKEGSFEVRQRIQDLAYPEGVNWSREDGIPRTISENAALRAFHSISNSYKMEKAQKRTNLAICPI